MRGMGSWTEDRAASRKTGKPEERKTPLGQEAGDGAASLLLSVPQACKLSQTELFGSRKSSFFLRPN